MFNQIFCQRLNYLQNQVPLGFYWARGVKWGCMTKNPCHVLAIVIRIFSNCFRYPKWSCYPSYISLSMFTKMQGCKVPPKVINVAIFGKYQIFQDRLKDSSQIKRNCVKTFDVRHDAKHYRESQGITGPLKMQFSA